MTRKDRIEHRANHELKAGRIANALKLGKLAAEAHSIKDRTG